MSSPLKKSRKPSGFDDLTNSEMTTNDQTNGQNNGSKSSTPLPKNKSTSRIPQKDEDLKVKKQKNVGGESNPPKFSLSLSTKEIEEDVYALTGKRHLRCKIKRDKKMEEDLDGLFPGSSLDNHDAESLQKRYT